MKNTHTRWVHYMEGPVGLEPTTPCLKGRCSNRLSYGPIFPISRWVFCQLPGNYSLLIMPLRPQVRLLFCSKLLRLSYGPIFPELNGYIFRKINSLHYPYFPCKVNRRTELARPCVRHHVSCRAFRCCA